MAREHIRLLISIWDDPDFIALEPAQQTVYLALSCSPDLSWCGVAPLLPKRLVKSAKGLTERKVSTIISALVDRRFLLLDSATDEVAVRTYVRHDKIIRQPNVAKAMGRALGLVRSEQIKEGITGELGRLLADEPDAKGWDALRSAYPELMAEVIAKGSVNPSVNPSRKGA